jgi:Rieske Fe-S protein
MKSTDGDRQTVPPDGRPDAEQPAWRRDFPIDWAQDHYVARRDFTKFLGLTSLAFIVGQLWIGVKSLLDRRRGRPGPRAVAQADDVRPGRSLVFRYPEEQDVCLLLRRADGSFLAFSQKCTHLSCAVVPRPEEGRLHCPCHNGFFDLETGRPLAGPPRRPLPRIALEVRDGIVYATGVEVSPA